MYPIPRLAEPVQQHKLLSRSGFRFLSHIGLIVVRIACRFHRSLASGLDRAATRMGNQGVDKTGFHGHDQASHDVVIELSRPV